MDITLSRNDSPRRSLMVVFTVEGRPGSIRFSKTLFVDQTAPASLTLSDAAFAAPKVKETAEARKARLKALPKATPAERLAKMEARLVKMKAQLAAPQAVAATPATASPAAVQAAPTKATVVSTAQKANTVVATKGKR